jgi:lysozyme
MAITEIEAEALLREDLRVAEKAVLRHVDVPLSDNQFAALVCFIFNVGAGNFEKSSLLRLLNRGWYEQVPAQMARWNKARGEVLGGLARRRAAEARLWNTPDDLPSFPQTIGEA